MTSPGGGLTHVAVADHLAFDHRSVKSRPVDSPSRVASIRHPPFGRREHLTSHLLKKRETIWNSGHWSSQVNSSNMYTSVTHNSLQTLEGYIYYDHLVVTYERLSGLNNKSMGHYKSA